MLASGQAHSAFSNYNSILIGDQAAGMGGAATAVVGDPSAGAWYNPASLAALKGQAFSASVGIYKKFDILYGANDDVVNAALRANRGFFQPIPSSTGSVVRPQQIEWLKDWTLTLSILVPEYDSYTGDINNANNNHSTLNLIDQSVWVGAAASRQLSLNEYFGFTVYYTARSLTQAITDRTYVSGSDYEIYTEDRSIKQNALVLIFGYLKTINENWNWGVSIRPPGLHVSGQATYYQTRILNGVNDAPVDFPELQSKSRIPAKLNMGVAYFGQPNWTWSADISIHAPESYSDVEEPSVAQKLEHRLTTNIAVGAEYRWVEWFKLRAGIFTNFSSHPNPDPLKVHGQGDHVDQLGFAANAALKSGPIEYTFGGYYTGGRGLSVQRYNRQFQVTDKTQNVFTMLVGTSILF